MEVQVWQRLRAQQPPCPYIAQLMEVYEDQESVYIVGERLTGEPGCYGAVPGVPTLVSQVVWWCCQLTVIR
jgi:hypothetical protein